MSKTKNKIQQPYLIKNGDFSDHRGTLTFVNDFSLNNVKRFYSICQSPENGPRAWQGHKTESKFFYCISGSFAVKLVLIDNWDRPSENLNLLSLELSARNSEVLVIPGGYANGLKALEQNSRLLIFSEFSIEDAKGDEQRFETQNWINWEKV